MQLRSRLGFFAMPAFSYGIWLGGLAIGVVALLPMVPLVERGGRAMRWFAGFLGGVMILNGLGHLGGSIYFGEWLPGSASAPLLLISAAWLLRCVHHGHWGNGV